MRSFWSTIPMLRIAFALIAGICLEMVADNTFHFAQPIMFVALVLLFFSSVIFVSINRFDSATSSFKLRIYHGTSLTLCLISFGYVLAWFYADKNFKQHFSNYLKDESFAVAEIINPPLDKEKIVTVIAQVKEVKNDDSAYLTSGKILINVLRDSLSNDLKYGDVILFKSKIQEFDEPKNPGEFNFKRYQSYHNILHRTFLKEGEWKRIGSKEGNILMAAVYHIRSYFLSIIMKYVKEKNDFGVASAIMLGYNDYMNGDIVRAYASSGTLHVLSVSGLHVGIMFIMLNFLLGWMDGRGRKFVIAKAVIIILFIWFYACLTGLSPSVLRSAMMFSLIQFGKVMIRNVNTYNIIAGSAILIMLFNPFIITDVGFQLSYLAVIGIIYLQPKVYGLVTIKNKLLDSGWMLIAVSIAAQIATLPLSLFYFHQFPNLFLISNLVVIPVSNLILFIGTGLFAVGNIPFLNGVVGWSFNTLLTGLNKFIFFIDQIPFALIQGISLTMIEMILMYLLVLLLCWLTEERRPKVLIASLFLVFTLASFNSYEAISNSEQKKIVVYSVPKQSAVAFIDGKKVFLDFDSALLNNRSNMLYHVKNHWWGTGVNEQLTMSNEQFESGKIVLFEGKKILIIDSAVSKSNFEMENKLKVDLVILSHNPKVYLETLKKMVDFNEIVFDSSCKDWRIKLWEKDCEKLGTKYWDVNRQGAFEKDL